MTTAEIKDFFILQGLQIRDVAQAIKEERTEVSKVINYRRFNERVRRKLEKKYGIRFHNHAESKHRSAA